MSAVLERCIAAKSRAQVAPVTPPHWRREIQGDAGRYDGAFSYALPGVAKTLEIAETAASTGTKVWDCAVALSRMFERESRGLTSDLLNLSFTTRTSIFWVAVFLMSIHWFCCSWGILSLVQQSQRDLCRRMRGQELFHHGERAVHVSGVSSSPIDCDEKELTDEDVERRGQAGHAVRDGGALGGARVEVVRAARPEEEAEAKAEDEGARETDERADAGGTAASLHDLFCARGSRRG